MFMDVQYRVRSEGGKNKTYFCTKKKNYIGAKKIKGIIFDNKWRVLGKSVSLPERLILTNFTSLVDWSYKACLSKHFTTLVGRILCYLVFRANNIYFQEDIFFHNRAERILSLCGSFCFISWLNCNKVQNEKNYPAPLLSCLSNLSNNTIILQEDSAMQADL